MIDNFAALIMELRGNPRAPLEFAAAISSFTEAQRKAFSKAAQQQLSAIRPKERDNFGWPTAEGHLARLAALAFCPRSIACRRMDFSRPPQEMKRMNAFASRETARPYEDAAARILIDRYPDWADQWLELQIGDGNTATLLPETVQRLIREGVCKKPQTEGYARVMVRRWPAGDLENDADFLEDMWLVFRVPTSAFGFLTHIKPAAVEGWKKKDRQVQWPQAIYYLAYHNLIDRDRLLDELLAALWRDFPTSERAGFMHFHNLLEPQQQELLKRQSTYIELLRCPAPPVVAFALKVLASLAKTDAFQAEETLRVLPAVFEIPGKSQPKAALSLLKTLVQKHGVSPAAAAEVALRGLSHGEGDVQIAALQCLTKWGIEPSISNRLQAAGEFISPLARPQFEELLKQAGGERTPAAKSAPTVEPPEVDLARELDARRERLGAIPQPLRDSLRLDAGTVAIGAGQLPPPCDWDAVATRLPGLGEVLPIRDIEELIDAISAALERVRSPLEVERILDGLSRLGLQRTADFEARTAALRQRLSGNDGRGQWGGRPGESSLLHLHGACPSWIALLHTWLDLDTAVEHEASEELTEQGLLDSLRARVTSYFAELPDLMSGVLEQLNRIGPERFANRGGSSVPVFAVLNLRAEAVRQRLLQRMPPAPQLALPTHEHGWIDPLEFVSRLLRMQASGQKPDSYDFLTALLRLAPDGRPRALQDAADLAEPVGAIVRYALGQSPGPTAEDRERKSFWLAAGRSRTPRASLQELAVLDLPAAAGAVEPARFRVRLEDIEAGDSRLYHAYLGGPPLTSIEPDGQTTFAPADYPVLAFIQRLGPKNNFFHSFGLPGWGEAWLASHWPSNPDPFLIGGIHLLLAAIDAGASSWNAAAPMLMPLLRSEIGWSETAMRAIWLALFSRDADARAVASDALIEGILDGRAHSEPLFPTLLEVARCKWAKLNRLADGLRPAGRVSGWGAMVVASVLDRLIASWQSPPRDAHYILELQLELLMETDAALSDSARRPLQSLTGSSKTAKLAKRLLQLGDQPDGPRRRAILLEALDIRLDRAEQIVQTDGTKTMAKHHQPSRASAPFAGTVG